MKEDPRVAKHPNTIFRNNYNFPGTLNLERSVF